MHQTCHKLRQVPPNCQVQATKTFWASGRKVSARSCCEVQKLHSQGALADALISCAIKITKSRIKHGGKHGDNTIHPYAQVLAMFAFDSYSQSKRSPRPLSRHRPCKTPFPIGNASFNKPWPNYHGSIMFYSFLIESHRNAGFQRAFFRGHCWRPQTKTRSRPFS